MSRWREKLLKSTTKIIFDIITILKPTPFRFEAFWIWISHPSCREVIGKAWNTQYNGSVTYQVCRKIKALKVELRKWNRDYFGRIQENIKHLQNELIWIQSLDPNPQSEELEWLTHCELQEFLKHEETLWKSKPRVQWLATSDLSLVFKDRI